MIIEHALLKVRLGEAVEFEMAMRDAKPLIEGQPGFQSIEVRPSPKQENQYLLLVGWDDIKSHRDGFRSSTEYQQWCVLLHKFYDPMPTVSYFGVSIFDD